MPCTDRGCTCSDHFKTEYVRYVQTVVGGDRSRTEANTEQILDRLAGGER